MLVEVPDGWEKKCLSEVLVRDTSAISASELASVGNVYHYSIPAFDEGQAPILEAGSQIRSNKTRISEDCLLFSKLNPRIPRVWRVRGKHEFPAVCSTEFWAFMPSRRKSSLDYFKHFFAWDGFLSNPQIKPSSSTNSHQRIDRKAFDAFEVLCPPLPEQQRIAEVLSSVDENIRATEAVISQAERVKRGLMKDLLTGGLGSAAIANGEVPEGWDLLPLGSIARIFTGKTPSTKEPENWGGKIPFVTPTDLNGSVFIGATERYLTDHGAAKLSMLPANSVLYTCIASIGKSGISTSPCVSNQQINSCVFNDANNPVFHYYQLQKCTPDLDALAGKTAVSIINKSKFSEFEVLCPPLPEQQRIAEILSSVDEQITTNRATVEQLQRLKRGFMDDLLTGKVRTVA